MSLAQLLPSVTELPRSDKLQLIQLLASQLAEEDSLRRIDAREEYPVWSPYDSHEAAATLHAFLDREKAARK